MQKETMAIFPQPVSRYKLWARSWQTQLNQVPRQFRGNHEYSESDRVLDQFPELAKIITDAVNDHSRTVLGIQEPMFITQSWINVYNQGDSIHQHSHPNSIVSGTWYWSSEPTSIQFHRTQLNSAQTWTIKIDQEPVTHFSSQLVSVPVEENDLLLWPSHLQHSVAEHAITQPRCSMSFNSMPRSWGSDLYRA
jgi:uncharacterized protein (TIGR02466 family)